MDGAPTSFWGKINTGPDGDVVSWHPLEDHCADVAAVFRLLLDRTCLGSRLAYLGGIQSLNNVQKDRLCALVALHDLGKYNTGFQNKAYGRTPRTDHLKPLLALFGYPCEEARSLSNAMDIPNLSQWADEESDFYQLLIATFCHHGRPLPIGISVDHDPAYWRPSMGLDPFRGIASLVGNLCEWYPNAFEEPSAGILPTSPAFQHVLNGLVNLADWIGSDTRFFRFTEEGDGDRLEFARSQAANALRWIGADTGGARRSLGDNRPVFSDLFPDFSPRGVQTAVNQMMPMSDGRISVLEAETGSGKTEAALLWFLRLFHANQVDGLYFGLPTRTAATQLYDRVLAVIQRVFPNETYRPPVVLAVPGYIRADGQEGERGLGRFDVLWPDDETDLMRYRGWAAETPRRFLAGAVVVGTIDQVLLGSLAVKYSHLRSAALLRHLLVVDEVHASDGYMNRLLKEALRKHVLAGGHALLMSATLGSAVREELLHPDTRTAVPGLEEALKCPYPSIITSGEREIPTPPGTDRLSPTIPKRIGVRVESWAEELAEVAETALTAAEQGARVLVIRNTVRDCVKTQRALEERAIERDRLDLLMHCGTVPAPHHSRYTADDRKLLDKVIESCFGKDRPTGGLVAVATQTVQQSLDLDADLMISDLCPMDVLLQRAGRLHRHDRTEGQRPSEFQRPCLVVITPPLRDLSRYLHADGELRAPCGLGPVYPDARIIEATWHLLEEFGQEGLRIPEMNRELVERSTHPEVLRTLTGTASACWQTHGQRMEAREWVRTRQAAVSIADWQVPFDDRRVLFPDDALGRMSTRLGYGDRIGKCTFTINGPFGEPFHEVNIPEWLSGKAGPDEALEILEYGESILMRFGGKRLVYDRLGLRAEEDQ